MKKVLVFLVMTVLLVTLSLSSFAQTGGFVSSPSNNQAPTLISFKANNENCDGVLVITPYAKRNELSNNLRDLLEKARNEIAASNDLTKLNSDLAQVASQKNIAGTQLAVSDLFNLHVTGCDAHEGHFDFDITLAAETLKHFVGLLQMKSDGTWELVKDAQVVNNGKHLKFSVNTLSPLAIVVNTDPANVPPTSDNWMIYVYGGIALVSGVSMVTVWFFWRKSKNQEN